MKPIRLLALAASMRKDSLNHKLILQAVHIANTLSEVKVAHVEFAEFQMPLYDGDIEDAQGVPAGAQALGAQIASCDGWILSTPEYNGGIPGTLKNAIDWISRMDPVPLEGKPVLLMGASPGALGAVRGLWHTRVPFEAVGRFVYPEMFGLSRAHQAFNEKGEFQDVKMPARLQELLRSYVTFVRRFHDGT